MFYSYAHSGRTDSSGGHYDRSTGEYHYHHGHSAHQHPNGVCPYTSTKTSNSDNISSTTGVNTANTDLTTVNMFFGSISLCLGVVAFIFFLKYEGFKYANNDLQENNDRLKKDNISLKEQVSHNEVIISSFKIENESLTTQLKEKQQEIYILEQRIDLFRRLPNRIPLLTYQEALKIAQVPDGVSFDKDNLPHYYSNPTVESHMNVYISSTGKKYHRIKGCSHATTPIHLFIAASSFTPCEKCIPCIAWNYQVPDWYFRYLQLMCQCKIIRRPDSNSKYQLPDLHVNENGSDTAPSEPK
jgi:hypothetical protein